MIRVIKDFKKFAFNRGNIIDLSIAVVVGTAFTTVVSSLASNIIVPLTNIVLTGKLGEVRVEKFFGDLLNFLIVAAALYIVTKIVLKWFGHLLDRVETELEHKVDPDAPPDQPDAKFCPECCFSIPYMAKRCPYCTTKLKEEGG